MLPSLPAAKPVLYTVPCRLPREHAFFDGPRPLLLGKMTAQDVAMLTAGRRGRKKQVCTNQQQARRTCCQRCITVDSSQTAMSHRHHWARRVLSGMLLQPMALWHKQWQYLARSLHDRHGLAYVLALMPIAAMLCCRVHG